MWNEPTKEDLAKLPKLYETEDVPIKDKIVHMHFFLAGCDWFACEWDGDRFFGYVVLNNDYQMAEWGYFSLSELKGIKVQSVFEIDRDLHWKPTEARHVDKICKGMGWPPSKKQVEHLLETSGILSDSCKKCGAIVDTEPSEKNLFCKECGATTIKEQFYIGKRMQAQKPTA
jgi:hypothetical protein